jgi:outer membrane protein assembly factor BamC
MQVLKGTGNTFMLKPVALLSGLLLMAAASGCSFIDDRSERYVNAKEGEPLELPESANEARFSQTMPIRDVEPADASRMYPSEIPRPPDMTSDILDENYVIEELDGRVWLLVNDVPGRIWPAVNTYMAERGLGVALDNPQLGILQSELANFSKRARQLVELPDNPSAEEQKVVVQVRMAPGVRRKTTSIQVRKLEVAEDPGELLPWEGVSAPSEQALALQKRILADMGEFLRAREESKSFSRAASGIVSDPLVRLVSENDEAIAIRMELDYGRSWAEVSRALTDSDIPVVDLNRSEGWFQVDFRTEDERDPGWFSWFGGSEGPQHTHTVNLEERGDVVVVTAGSVPGYSGSRTTSELLTQLFDYLY